MNPRRLCIGMQTIQHKRPLCIRMKPDLLIAARAVSEEDGVTLTRMIEWGLQKEVDRRKAERQLLTEMMERKHAI